MSILYSFYNNGDIRLSVTEEKVLESCKNFFDKDRNCKNFSSNITYEEYKNMTDKQHINKAKTMPIKFLKSSGKDLFVDKEGYTI